MQFKAILLAAVASIAGAAPAAAPEPAFGFCVGAWGCGFGEVCVGFRCQNVAGAVLTLAAGAAIGGAIANANNGGAAPALPALPALPGLPGST